MVLPSKFPDTSYPTFPTLEVIRAVSVSNPTNNTNNPGRGVYGLGDGVATTGESMNKRFQVAEHKFVTLGTETNIGDGSWGATLWRMDVSDWENPFVEILDEVAISAVNSTTANDYFAPTYVDTNQRKIVRAGVHAETLLDFMYFNIEWNAACTQLSLVGEGVAVATPTAWSVAQRGFITVGGNDDLANVPIFFMEDDYSRMHFVDAYNRYHRNPNFVEATEYTTAVLDLTSGALTGWTTPVDLLGPYGGFVGGDLNVVGAGRGEWLPQTLDRGYIELYDHFGSGDETLLPGIRVTLSGGALQFEELWGAAKDEMLTDIDFCLVNKTLVGRDFSPGRLVANWRLWLGDITFPGESNVWLGYAAKGEQVGPAFGVIAREAVDVPHPVDPQTFGSEWTIVEWAQYFDRPDFLPPSNGQYGFPGFFSGVLPTDSVQPGTVEFSAPLGGNPSPSGVFLEVTEDLSTVVRHMRTNSQSTGINVGAGGTRSDSLGYWRWYPTRIGGGSTWSIIISGPLTRPIYSTGWLVGAVGWESPGNPAPPPVPECPVFVGRTQTTLGGMGPYPLAGLTGIVWAAWSTIDRTVYRYNYPVNGSAPSIVFQLPTSAGAIAPDADGSLWWVSDSGEVNRRASATGTATDALRVSIGAGSRYVMARSNYNSGDSPMFYCIDCPEGNQVSIYRVSISLSTWIATKVLTATVPVGATRPFCIATGQSIYLATRTNDPEFHLWRYDIPSNALVHVDQVQSAAIAPDGNGYCVYQSSSAPKVWSRVREWEDPQPLDCEVLADGVLQGGGEVPGNSSIAVLSHYLGFTGEPDGDYIWEWPS